MSLTLLGSMTATFPLPSFEANFAAVEQPPAPPPTTTSLKLKATVPVEIQEAVFLVLCDFPMNEL